MSKQLERAIEYNVIGGITFIVNILLAWILFSYGHVQYLVATACGSFLQAIVAFFMNKKWTFHIKQISIWHGLIITVIIQISVTLVALSLMAIGVEILQLKFIFARLMSAIIAGAWAYVADSYFTFRVSPLSKN